MGRKLFQYVIVFCRMIHPLLTAANCRKSSCTDLQQSCSVFNRKPSRPLAVQAHPQKSKKRMTCLQCHVPSSPLHAAFFWTSQCIMCRHVCRRGSGVFVMYLASSRNVIFKSVYM
jgi:hypothetical protein